MKKQKILIVDDDREHLLMVALTLRKEGYDVISASGVDQAIQVAVEQEPDLLLLDVHLGDHAGYAVQERLQQIDEMDKPTIYITGDRSGWIQCVTSALGAHAVLRKPFERDELICLIRRALGEKSSVPATG